MSGPGLRVDVTVMRPRFRVRAGFEVPAGGSIAVLGPNGSGKSTLLAAIAGFAPLHAGEVTEGGRLLERAGGPRTAPERRRITLLGQAPRLFPHLSIEQNIAFGPRAQGRSRLEARRIAGDWLERVALTARARSRPHELSGGQQQRVAIARAFAGEPRVLLLDEPFAALDAESAPVVRRMLMRELSRTGTTSVLVTHDLAEVQQWADRALVLDRGAVVEDAPTAVLAARPGHPFTAALAGFDVIQGVWTGAALATGELRLPGKADPAALPPGSAAFAIVAPHAVAVSADPSPGAIPMRLEAISSRAGIARLEFPSGLAAELPVDDASRLVDGDLPRPGAVLWIDPRSVRVVPGPVRGDAGEEVPW